MAAIDYPLFFTHERVWRCYTGGALLDRFIGNTPEVDGHLPEDWLASTVLASNGEHSPRPDEGLVRVLEPDGTVGKTLKEVLAARGSEILGPAHTAKYGDTMALLCKYLDSAIRLPLQCHPDAATAKRLFGAQFGKTECWQIIDTRPINGETPYILLGFKPGLRRQDFIDAAKSENINAMIPMLHKILVKPGQTYFVPGRMPHAIGPGVFMLEVQEPSDLVVQPERYCADVQLTESDMWGCLSQDQALDVFEYTPFTESQLLARVGPTNRIVSKSDSVVIAELIGESHTGAFGLLRASIRGNGRIKLPGAFAVIVVESGSGTMRWTGGSRPIRRGEYFLQPASVPFLDYETADKLELLICLPPMS